MKRQFYMREAANARDQIQAAWQVCREIMRAGDGVRLKVEPVKPTRTLDQNNILWSVLTDIAQQVQWPVDGRMQHLTADDWKDVLTAGLRKSQRVAQGVEGGFVMLGQRTSKMTIAEMGELITLAHAFGSEHGVRWSPTSVGREAA